MLKESAYEEIVWIQEDVKMFSTLYSYLKTFEGRKSHASNYLNVLINTKLEIYRILIQILLQYNNDAT